VWVVHLRSQPAGLEAVLSPDERAQAHSLRTAALRRRFVLRRAARRHILGGYLGLPAHDVRFRRGVNGKPEPADRGLHVNCSHREELAVVAVCAAPLGVDVEYVGAGSGPEPAELDALARVMLSPAELAAYCALPAAGRRTALLTVWTRKEAVVKALGVGLSLPLDSFDVPVEPTTPPRLLARRGAARDGKLWSMVSLDLPAGYVGTVMAAGSRCRVHMRTWAPPTHFSPRRRRG